MNNYKIFNHNGVENEIRHFLKKLGYSKHIISLEFKDGYYEEKPDDYANLEYYCNDWIDNYICITLDIKIPKNYDKFVKFNDKLSKKYNGTNLDFN